MICLEYKWCTVFWCCSLEKWKKLMEIAKNKLGTGGIIESVLKISFCGGLSYLYSICVDKLVILDVIKRLIKIFLYVYIIGFSFL